MNKFGFLILTVMVLMVSWTACHAQQTEISGSPELEKAARGFVDILAKGDFTEATVNFDSTMKAAMSPDKLSDAWKSVIGEVGPFRKQGEAHIQKVRQYDVVAITCEFEKSPLDIQVTFDSQKHIAGLFFAPSKPKADYKEPGYSNPKAFREMHRQIGTDEWALPGTLTLPAGPGPFPAVVLVHGSGPNDRDETIGPNKPFRDIAEALASQGIAVLRYDKRTMVYSQKLVDMKDSLTTKEESVDDAVRAVELLRGTVGIDSTKVFVLGHSLGGMLAPKIGTQDPNIAGLIIMAGTTRPLEDVILAQFNYIFSIDGEMNDQQKAQIEKIKEQVANVKNPTLSPATQSSELPLGMPARYWLDLRGYDPAAEASNLQVPMLILQGERDYQVTTADFDGWKKALGSHKNVEFKLYPKLNHLLIEGEGKSTPSEYENAGNVSVNVIDDIANWIKKH
jgi:dienelactone hydrolase